MPQYSENVTPASSQTVGTSAQPWQAGYFSNLYLNGAALAANSTFSSVTFSTNPSFNSAGNNSVFKMTLTGNVLSSTLAGAVAGNFITFILAQDGAGGRTFAWPGNVLGATPVGLSASQVTVQTFVYDGSNAYPVAPGAMYP